MIACTTVRRQKTLHNLGDTCLRTAHEQYLKRVILIPGRTMTHLHFDKQCHKNQLFKETHARLEPKHTRSIDNVHSAFVQKMLVYFFSKSDYMVWWVEKTLIESNIANTIDIASWWSRKLFVLCYAKFILRKISITSCSPIDCINLCKWCEHLIVVSVTSKYS